MSGPYRNDSCPGCGAARSGAPQIRDRYGLERSRVCSASLHAALRLGQGVVP
jgi:hypothetical protein